MSRPLSYQHVLDAHGRKAEQFQCAECGTKECVTNTGDRPPDLIIKVIKARGWKADAFKPLSHFCPKCAGPQKKSAAAKQGNVIPMSVTPIAKPSVEVRQPTSDQRVKIRDSLDNHFDDVTGRYLDGFSDQKIAELVDVPRIIVERIREVGYGPIKDDPVLIALRAEIVALQKLLEEQQRNHDTLKAKLTDAITRLDKSLPKAA